MNDLSDLSPPAAAAQRATEAGHGVLAVGRPWVQFEGWVLKESGALTGGWHLRYFVVSGDRLEYFREEKVKLEPKPGESASTFLASLSLDQTNVVCIANSNASPPPKERQLQEGDVIIGINGEPCVGRPAGETLAEALSSGPATCVVLRPKGRIALHGATAVSGGPRKGGGHMLTVSVNDSSSRRSKYNLVCADERLCAGWIASIKEAIAASAMEEIKTAVRTLRSPSPARARTRSRRDDSASAHPSDAAHVLLPGCAAAPLLAAVAGTLATSTAGDAGLGARGAAVAAAATCIARSAATPVLRRPQSGHAAPISFVQQQPEQPRGGARAVLDHRQAAAVERAQSLQQRGQRQAIRGMTARGALTECESC
jgi:hypothetical protein